MTTYPVLSSESPAWFENEVRKALLEMDEIDAQRVRRAAALRRFRRAMRRHERRARRMGVRGAGLADLIREKRLLGSPRAEEALRSLAVSFRGWSANATPAEQMLGHHDTDRHKAFICERAADAVAKLRGAREGGGLAVLTLVDEVA